MAYRVELSGRAEADIAAIYAYIRTAALEVAVDWVRRLRDEIASLANSPARCSLAPESEWLHDMKFASSFSAGVVVATVFSSLFSNPNSG